MLSAKKMENHCHAIALHFVYYNFVRLHKTLNVTPAMAAGLSKRFMTIEDIARLIPEPQVRKRGNYQKKEKKFKLRHYRTLLRISK